jgi:hypothetical protein
MDRLFLFLASIPFLIAAPADDLPASVQDLLNKPRYGEARVTWMDGRQSEGSVKRVTDQFVTFAPRSGACENVELPKISSIDWIQLRVSDDFPLWSIPLLPFVGLWENLTPSVRAPFLGDWRSTDVSTDGRFSRVGINSDQSIWREEVIIKKGIYRIDHGTLYITYAGSAPDEAMRTQFVCDELLL